MPLEGARKGAMVILGSYRPYPALFGCATCIIIFCIRMIDLARYFKT